MEMSLRDSPSIGEPKQSLQILEAQPTNVIFTVSYVPAFRFSCSYTDTGCRDCTYPIGLLNSG